MLREQDLEGWVVYVACPTLDFAAGHLADWSSVVMLDARDLSILNGAILGPRATRLALSPDGSRLWVSHFEGSQISVLDATTLDVIEVINLGETHSYGIATPRPSISSVIGGSVTGGFEEGQALVAYENRGEVAVYNMGDKTSLVGGNRLLRTIPVSVRPSVIVLTPDGRKAYVIDYGIPPQIAVITPRGELTTIPCSGFGRLQEAVVSPDGTTVYVTNQGTPGQIEVIRTSDNALLEPIETDDEPRAIGISPDGAYLFVGHVGQPASIKMLRLSDNRVVGTESVYHNPRTMAVAPTAPRIFVADHDNNSNECYAFDVLDKPSGAGGRLSRAAVVSLNTKPGFPAMPVELVIGRPPLK